MDNTDDYDVNGNGCDWYNEDFNALECGDHDASYSSRIFFEAYEHCCVCKYLSGI